MEYTHIVHGFPPVFDEHSRILILGSLPSVLSRKNQFYYGHPQNRFWKVLAHLWDAPLPQSIEEKKAFLLSNGIALWDVVAKCDIAGSSDASIRNVIPTDLPRILDTCDIQALYANGAAAAKIYNRFQKPVTRREILPLPSTSPANAAWSLEKLCEAWSVLCP
ncbi:MAG: DNA-deoxyinosine glycosylase [Acutalibacteraceae bacterium]